MNEKTLRQSFTILCCTLLSCAIYGQDIHFSQFYQSPLNLNPALTGVMRSNQRFVANYRNQWASALGANAYNTYSASYDQKIQVGTYDYFGVGGSMWGDVAGASRFGMTSARLSGSFSYYMNGGLRSAHYLSVGADIAVTQRRVRTGDLRWPSQHNNGEYDPASGSSEDITNNNILYPDLSVGLMWFSIFDETNSLYVGIASAHLNEANVSFLNSDVSLYRRYTLHGGGEYGLSSTLSLVPGFVVMVQGPHREYNFGTSIRIGIGEDTGEAFQVGLWTRLGIQAAVSGDGGTNAGSSLHSDALIFSTKFESGKYGLGFSYDFTTSQFKQAGTANGSFEFSFSYLINQTDRRKFWYPKVHG